VVEQGGGAEYDAVGYRVWQSVLGRGGVMKRSTVPDETGGG